jgi:NADH:ubiquinone oxidoreductase subunit E
MRLTPAYLASVATFYDMLETTPVGRHSVYVCTNISCSLRGADALFAAICDAAGEGAGGDPDINVRAFECLGACDIAPMASVDGVYVGPLSVADVPRLLEDVRAGRPVLPDKQLATRPVADQEAGA